MNNKYLNVKSFFLYFYSYIFKNIGKKKFDDESSKNAFFILGCFFKNFNYDKINNFFWTEYNIGKKNKETNSNNIDKYFEPIIVNGIEYKWIKNNNCYKFILYNDEKISGSSFFKNILNLIESINLNFEKLKQQPSINTKKYKLMFISGYWESKCSIESKKRPCEMILAEHKKNCNIDKFDNYLCLKYFDFDIDDISFNIRKNIGEKKRNHQIRFPLWKYISYFNNESNDKNIVLERLKEIKGILFKNEITITSDEEKSINNYNECDFFVGPKTQARLNEMDYNKKDIIFLENTTLEDETLNWLIFPFNINEYRYFKTLNEYSIINKLIIFDLLEKIYNQVSKIFHVYINYDFKSNYHIKITVNESKKNDHNYYLLQETTNNKYKLEFDCIKDVSNICLKFYRTLLINNDLYSYFRKKNNNFILNQYELNITKSPITYMTGSWGSGKSYFINIFSYWLYINKVFFTLLTIKQKRLNVYNKLIKKINKSIEIEINWKNKNGSKFVKNISETKNKNYIECFLDYWESDDKKSSFKLIQIYDFLDKSHVFSILNKINFKKYLDNNYYSFFDRIIYIDAWYFFSINGNHDEFLINHIYKEVFNSKRQFYFFIKKLFYFIFKHKLPEEIQMILNESDKNFIKIADYFSNRFNKNNSRKILVIIDNIERLGKYTWKYINAIKKIQVLENLVILFVTNVNKFEFCSNKEEIDKWLEKFTQIKPIIFKQQKRRFLDSLKNKEKNDSIDQVINKKLTCLSNNISEKEVKKIREKSYKKIDTLFKNNHKEIDKESNFRNIHKLLQKDLNDITKSVSNELDEVLKKNKQ